MDDQQLREEVLWLVGSIKDPQKRELSLEDLEVINKQSVIVESIPSKCKTPQRSEAILGYLLRVITVRLQPTNPHCHLIQQIALAVHLRLKRQLLNVQQYKIRVSCFPGSHSKQTEVEKQMNDKERIAAALENEQIVKYLNELLQ